MKKVLMGQTATLSGQNVSQQVGQTEVSHLQPTFGRYAEIPCDQMTREQQEGYRSLVKAEGREPGSELPGPLKMWVNNPQLSTAVASVTWQHSTPFAKSA